MEGDVPRIYSFYYTIFLELYLYVFPSVVSRNILCPGSCISIYSVIRNSKLRLVKTMGFRVQQEEVHILILCHFPAMSP